MRLEIGVAMVLRAYWTQKEKGLKPCFCEIVEEIRQKHFINKYGEHEFLGRMKKVGKSIKRNGLMGWILEQKNSGKNWQEISDMFDKHISFVQEKISFTPFQEQESGYDSPGFDIYLALQHLHDAGGVATPDVLSPLEERLIGVE